MLRIANIVSLSVCHGPAVLLYHLRPCRPSPPLQAAQNNIHPASPVQVNGLNSTLDWRDPTNSVPCARATGSCASLLSSQVISFPAALFGLQYILQAWISSRDGNPALPARDRTTLVPMLALSLLLCTTTSVRVALLWKLLRTGTAPCTSLQQVTRGQLMQNCSRSHDLNAGSYTPSVFGHHNHGSHSPLWQPCAYVCRHSASLIQVAGT